MWVFGVLLVILLEFVILGYSVNVDLMAMVRNETSEVDLKLLVVDTVGEFLSPNSSRRSRKKLCQDLMITVFPALQLGHSPLLRGERRKRFIHVFEMAVTYCPDYLTADMMNTFFILLIDNKRFKEAYKYLEKNENRMRTSPYNLCYGYRWARVTMGISRDIPFSLDFKRMFSYCRPILKLCNTANCKAFIANSFSDFFDTWDDSSLRAGEFSEALVKCLDLFPRNYFMSSLLARIQGNYRKSIDDAIRLVEDVENDLDNENECMASKLMGRSYVKMIASADSDDEILSIAKECCSSKAFKHMMEHDGHPRLAKDMAICVSHLWRDIHHLDILIKVTTAKAQKYSKFNSISLLWESAAENLPPGPAKLLLEQAVLNRQGKDNEVPLSREAKYDLGFSAPKRLNFTANTSDSEIIAMHALNMIDFIMHPNNRLIRFFPIIAFALYDRVVALKLKVDIFDDIELCPETKQILRNALNNRRKKSLGFEQFYVGSKRKGWSEFPVPASVGCCISFTVTYNFLQNLVDLSMEGRNLTDPTLFHEWKSYNPVSYGYFGRHLETFLDLIAIENSLEYDVFANAEVMIERYESVRPFFFYETAWRIAELIDPFENPTKALEEGRLAASYFILQKFYPPFLTYARILHETALMDEPFAKELVSNMAIVILEELTTTGFGKRDNHELVEIMALTLDTMRMLKMHQDIVVTCFTGTEFSVVEPWLREPGMQFVLLDSLFVLHDSFHDRWVETFDNLVRVLMGQTDSRTNFLVMLATFLQDRDFKDSKPVITELLQENVWGNRRMIKLLLLQSRRVGLEVFFNEILTNISANNNHKCSEVIKSNNATNTCFHCCNNHYDAHSDSTYSSAPTQTAVKKGKKRSALRLKQPDDLHTSKPYPCSLPKASAVESSSERIIMIHGKLMNSILSEWDWDMFESFRTHLKSFSFSRDLRKVRGLSRNIPVWRVRWYQKNQSYRILLTLKGGSKHDGGPGRTVMVYRVFPKAEGYPTQSSFSFLGVKMDNIDFYDNIDELDRSFFSSP